MLATIVKALAIVAGSLLSRGMATRYKEILMPFLGW
jgi:hypothetical protein